MNSTQLSGARLLVLTLSALLAGCAGDTPEVVAYCALDQEHSEAILGLFQERTGISVRAVFDNEQTKTVGLRTKIQQERNAPRCDVFWNNEIVNTVILKNEGLLEPYESPSAAAIPEQFQDPDHQWTGFAARARIFIVNEEECAHEDAPTSYLDYLDDEYNGEWCIAKPVAGTTATHVAVLLDLLGEQETREWLLGVRQNGAAIYTGNAHVMREVRRGTRRFGFTDTDDFRVAEVEGYPVYSVYPDQGEDEIGCLVIPNTISLVKDGPNPEAAKQLIDFVLSEEVEQLLAGSRSAQIPVRPDVPCPDHVRRISELKLMPADFNRAAGKFEEAQELVRETLLKPD